MNKTWKPRSLVMSLMTRLQQLLKRLSKKLKMKPKKLPKNKSPSRPRFKLLLLRISRLLRPPLLRMPQMSLSLRHLRSRRRFLRPLSRLLHLNLLRRNRILKCSL